MGRKLLTVGIVLILIGAAAATVAAQTSDEAVDGIHLSPADTPNGQNYAEIATDGELVVDLPNLNADAVTSFDSLFTISSTRDEETPVWIEPAADGISFFRMDTGEPIASPSSALVLGNGETVAVGMRVDTSRTPVRETTVTLRARFPDAEGPGDGGNDTDGDDPGPPPTTATPEPPTTEPPTPPTTQTPEPPTTEPPTPPTTATPDPPTTGGSPTTRASGPGTPGSPTTTSPAPDPEVGGFPWLPLAALVAALLLVPLALFVYRWLQEPELRFEAPADSEINLSSGSFDEDHYAVTEDSVTLSYAETDLWADRDPDASVAIEAAVVCSNAGETPLAVGVEPDTDGFEGVRIVADAGDGHDLRAESLTLAPDAAAPVTVVLPPEAHEESLTVRFERREEQTG